MLNRYMAIRRHTAVGTGDSRRDIPPDVRHRLATRQAIASNQRQPPSQGPPQQEPMQNNVLPVSVLPHTNLPHNLPLVQNEPLQNFCIKDPHLLRPPQIFGNLQCAV